MDILLITIIAINAVVSFKGFNDQLFFRKYEFHIGSIRAGEQIRMLTSGFLHVDIPHLAFNMYALWIFGPILTQQFSDLIFLYVYFGSLISGSLLTYYFHKDEYHYRAVGASGAVTGIIYSAILLYPDMNLNLMFIPIDIPGYVFGIGYLLYSIYGMKAKTDNIGHTAHFGGAIGGYLITLSINSHLIFDNTLMVVLLAIPIVILFYLHKTNKL